MAKLAAKKQPVPSANIDAWNRNFKAIYDALGMAILELKPIYDDGSTLWLQSISRYIADKLNHHPSCEDPSKQVEALTRLRLVILRPNDCMPKKVRAAKSAA